PGIIFDSGMRDGIGFVEITFGVAVNGSFRGCLIIRARLRRLALTSDIFVSAKDLNFRQRQEAIRSRQGDANDSAVDRTLRGACGGYRSLEFRHHKIAVTRAT